MTNSKIKTFLNVRREGLTVWFLLQRSILKSNPTALMKMSSDAFKRSAPSMEIVAVLVSDTFIYFNICSKIAKGSSRDLMPLIAAYLKISLTVKIEQTRRKNHTLEVNGNGWTEKKRLGKLIHLYISFKFSIRNSKFKASQLIS